MWGRIWERVARLWRVRPCAVCGRPSVGFRAAVEGKLLTTDGTGQPVTRYYLGAPQARCAECLRQAERPAG